MTVSFDDRIGKVIEVLDANVLSEDTLVIVLTDHGEDPVFGESRLPYCGDKATLFEGGLWVPCIMRWTGLIEAGSASDVACNSSDLFPTFCSLAGITSDDLMLDRRNLSSLMI
tara:strand:- start:828 stop:1166 length:339 start_codon:yes stop_codon:yes gene_type:complete